MKITRRQLRQLISEAARTIIVDPKDNATPSDIAFKKGRVKDSDYGRMDPGIGQLMGLDDYDKTSVGPDGASFRAMGRMLGDTLPMDDESLRPDPLTPAEETAVDQLGYYAQIQDRPTESLIDIPQFIKRRNNKSYIDILSKVYGEDGDKLVYFISDMTHMTPENDYEDQGDELRAFSKVLNCDIEEIANIPQEGNGRNPLYYQLMDYIYATNSARTQRTYNIDGLYFNTFVVEGKTFIFYIAFGGFRSLYYCAR